MIYSYDEIVIGSNLRALLFAFTHNLPIFFTRPQRPVRFEYLSPIVDLESIGIPSLSRSLLTHAAPRLVGAPKEVLWDRLLFVLSLGGQAPLSNLCENIRHTGHSLVCSNAYSKIYELTFKKAYYFGDSHCEGLVSEKKVANPIYTCYDWIAFNRGGKHEIDYIETPDDFVQQVWFYPSDRIDGNTLVKDACVVSMLSEEQLLNFDYSQTMARFKMIAEMKARGMKGVFNGYSPTGIPKYYKFRTTIIGRERYPQSPSACPSVAAVEIPDVTEEDLLKDLSTSCVGYHRLLNNL